MNKGLRKTITLLVVAVLALTGIIGCIVEPKPVEEIAIAVTPWPASAALYVAREKGYFRDERLDVALHSYISGHLGLVAHHC